MAINKAKLKTLTRLCDKGFDTHKKILAIDMRAARDNGLDDDISGILDLHDVFAPAGHFLQVLYREKTRLAGNIGPI